MFTNKERLYYIKVRLLLGSFIVCLVFSGLSRTLLYVHAINLPITYEKMPLLC